MRPGAVKRRRCGLHRTVVGDAVNVEVAIGGGGAGISIVQESNDHRRIGAEVAVQRDDVVRAGAVQRGRGANPADLHAVDRDGVLGVALIGIFRDFQNQRIGGQKLNGHASHARVAGILQPVPIQVQPHIVANGSGGCDLQSGVDVVVGLTGDQRDRGGNAGGGIGLAVDRRTTRQRDVLGGEDIAGRGDEFDLVGARVQIGEGIGAVGIGRRGRQDRRAGAVQQFHRDARHAGFTIVQQAVLVGIQEHGGTQCRRLDLQPGVDVVVGLAGGQCDRGGDAGGGIGLAVDCRSARQGGVLRGEDIAGRGDILDLVCSRGEIGERVVAGGVGRGRRQDGGAGAVQQLDGDAGNAGFAVVQQPVTVGVQEYRGTQRCRLDLQACVDVVVGLPGGQRDRGGDAGGGIGLAVDRRSTRQGGVLGGEDIAGRGDEFDLVGARVQIGEGIGAVGIGRRGRQDRRAGAVQQFHRDARHAGFTIVQQAVLVGIQEHGGTQCRRLDLQPGVDVVVGLAGGQCDRGGDAGGGIGLAVDCRSARQGGVLRGEDIAGRGDILDLVCSGGEVGERVVAGGVGGGCRQNSGAGAVQQFDGDAGDAGFAVVQHSVTVGIQEHGGAECRRLDLQPGVDGVVGLAGGQRDRGGDPGGGIGLAVDRRSTRQGSVLRGEDIAGRGDEFDLIGARGKVSERVIATGVGRGGRQNAGARCVQKLNRDAGDAGLAVVELTVLVGIQKHGGTQRRRDDLQTGVDAVVDLAGRQGDQRGQA